MDIKLSNEKLQVQNTYKPRHCRYSVCCTTHQLQQMPRPISKILSKVTNPVISIEPCRSRSGSYFDKDDTGQPFITKARPRSPQSDRFLKKQRKRKARSIRPSRSPIYVQCFNPMVSIPPMTKEVQSNINIYPKLRPRPMKVTSSAKTVYEYKYPYSSSDDEEFAQILPSPIGLKYSNCHGNDAYMCFETGPTFLHGDKNIVSSRLSKEQSSKLNSSLENQIDLTIGQSVAKEHDCDDDDDIESLVILERPSHKHESNIKPMSSNSETDFMLNKFSSRLEERLEIFLESITFGQSSTIKEGPNYTKAPICELLQSSEITHEKDAISNTEEQKNFTQPTIIPLINEFAKNKDELSCKSSLGVKAEVKCCNKCSQTEPFSEDNYLNNKEISFNKYFDQNIEKECRPSPYTILIDDEKNHSCYKTNSNVIEFSQDSKVSAVSKQVKNKKDPNICMNETFDIYIPYKNHSIARNFVESYVSLYEAKSELPFVPTTSQQNLEATELPLIFSQNNTYLPHNKISTQELDLISKVNSVGSASPKQAAINSIEIIANKNTLYKLSESFKSIRIEGSDEDKHTGIPNENSNESLRSTVDTLLDQIPPKFCENVDEINSCYSEKLESDVQDIEASIDHKIASIDKTEDLFTFPSSSEIEYFEVHESTNEVSSGEIFQPPFEVGDLTISEGELGFGSSLTSDILPIGHIAIKVTPKDTSLLEPSFSLDFNSFKCVKISKETQTEFPIIDQFLKNSRADVAEFSWTKDVDDTVSSGELIQDSDKTFHYATTLEKENLLKENLKLRNKLSFYSGRFCLGFVKDPG